MLGVSYDTLRSEAKLLHSDACDFANPLKENISKKFFTTPIRAPQDQALFDTLKNFTTSCWKLYEKVMLMKSNDTVNINSTYQELVTLRDATFPSIKSKFVPVMMVGIAAITAIYSWGKLAPQNTSWDT